MEPGENPIRIIIGAQPMEWRRDGWLSRSSHFPLFPSIPFTIVFIRSIPSEGHLDQRRRKKGVGGFFFSVPLLQQEGSCCDPSSACQTCFSLSFLLESFHNDIRPSSRVRQRRRAGKCFVEGGPRLSLSGWPHLYAAIRRVV